jgi:4-amino-4-deoxy-L-arabinose transferase-like glycosyltransferase
MDMLARDANGTVAVAPGASLLPRLPDGSAAQPRRLAAARWLTVLALAGPFALFWALSVGLQLAGGAFGNDFGSHSDEPGHYVTGLLVRDYLAGLDWGHPRAFAENYYAHYPKVALGHWPPFFYLVQAAWTIPFGPSRVSVLLLMAALTAVLALAVYRSVRGEFGAVLGWMAGLLFVALPLVQIYTNMLMADILTGLLCFWAALCFGRFLDTASWRSAAAFGVLASLAILTKGSGLVLGLMVPLAVVMGRRWGLLLRPAFWLPAGIVLLLCGPWTYLTRGMAHNGFIYPSPTLAFTIPALGFFSWGLVEITGVGLFALVALGMFVKVVRPLSESGVPNERCSLRAGVEGKWAACGALILAVWLFHCVVPVGWEERYLIPAVPAALLFLAAGMAWLAARLPRRWPADRRVALVAAAVVLVFAVETFTLPRRPFSGFGEVGRELLWSPVRSGALLVSSDPRGEGAFIAAVAAGERRPGHVVLRASKALADSDWQGGGYTSFCRTPAEVMRRLEELGVGVVVLDTSAPPTADLEHHRLLGETVAAYPQRWQQLSTHDVVRWSEVHPQALRAYRLLGQASEPH